MGLFRTLLFSSTLVLSLGQAQAAYNDAGTDYTTASSGSWIEDASKQALNMVNAFVCIIKNSNGDSRPNGTWRILIDEVACGLNNEDSVAWADQIAVSTRASNSSDQEVISYFSSADGSKYVATTTLNENATSDYGLTMLFKWYAANDIYGNGGSDITSTGYVDGASNPFGFSEITIEDYDSDGTDDTVIRTAETFGDGTLGGIVVNYGGTPTGAATAFLVSAPDYSSGGQVIYAGALSDTEYLRQVYDSDASSFGGDTCYTNENPFQSVYRYGVYDSDTGEELSISGSFGFTYETGGVSGESGRGFLGHWGVWFDDRRDKLSSSNTSLAITNDTEDDLVINWSPGKMWQKDASEVSLSDGEKFEFYDWTNGSRNNVTWSDTDSDFVDLDGNVFTFGGGVSIEKGDWFYSERFDTWVGYLGLTDGDYKIYVEKNTNVKSHWNGTGSQAINVSEEVDFICASNCPNANIPVVDYETYSFVNDGLNAGETYILTPYDESRSGIYPLALYKGTVDAANLVSFDPSEDWSSNTHAHIWTGNFIPVDDIDVDEGGTCDAVSDPTAEDNMYNCPNLFVWESGLREWGQGVVVTNSADGSAVTIQDPIQFTYTHAAANDRNNANYATEAGSPFNYTWVETDWSDLSQTTTASTFGVDLVDGVSLNLEYEGMGQLHGFMERQTPNGWMKLINLADGTEITRVSDSSTYVVKALDTGLLLNTQACSGDLSVPAAFQDLSIIPAPTDKSKPSQIFNNAPTVTSIHVKQGEDLIDPSLVQANE